MTILSETFDPALSTTTFRLGLKNCFSVEPVLSMQKIERIAKTAQYHNYVSFLYARLNLWPNDPKINRVIPLPQESHVAKFVKDPIYRTKVIVWKWSCCQQGHHYYKLNFWQQDHFRTITLVLYIGSLPNLATWFPCGRGITLFILGSLPLYRLIIYIDGRILFVYIWMACYICQFMLGA
jgi:hypothetical protein